MHARRPLAAGAGLLVLLMAGAALWYFPKPVPPPPSSDFAFRETWLNAAQGIRSAHRTKCTACHSGSEPATQTATGMLAERARLSRETWAEAISLQARCGLCHTAPDPSNLPASGWGEAVGRMEQIMELRGVPRPDADALRDIRHFYYTFSHETLPPLAPDPAPEESPLRFERSTMGNPLQPDSRERPVVGHLQAADLFREGQPGLLACDTAASAVKWIHRRGNGWSEELLAKVPHPAHTQLVPAANGAGTDIVVACLGAMLPTDDLVGSVVYLRNDGSGRFTARTILDGVSRVVDVEPGDFDGDGDLDFIVASYGFINQGEVGWLERLTDGAFRYHLIVKKAGAIHVPPADLDGDGRLDFVALFAQEHEEIVAFLNRGGKGFEPRLLFKAAGPSYGSSGIQLADLDGDGDPDILYTNGDNLDQPSISPRPYHGVQWLENLGNLAFVWHDIYRSYGAYCAVACDLNGDGRTDVALTTLFNDWSDPHRASLLWLESTGQQRFTPHTIATAPTHLISAAVADFDGDGLPDIAASGMHGFPPFDRLGRVTLWSNRTARR